MGVSPRAFCCSHPGGPLWRRWSGSSQAHFRVAGELELSPSSTSFTSVPPFRPSLPWPPFSTPFLVGVCISFFIPKSLYCSTSHSVLQTLPFGSGMVKPVNLQPRYSLFHLFGGLLFFLGIAKNGRCSSSPFSQMDRTGFISDEPLQRRHRGKPWQPGFPG